ncbi:Hypothetical predicted protein [Octopus vulgaris]|uniref:Uncharacterized protein n=1 Tax=Octopus vulgaris TaxID=6645 RepID=A0AA36FN74_OCTVU|nr:Hypothetical predicted protein [Octopus vulgaris]
MAVRGRPKAPVRIVEVVMDDQQLSERDYLLRDIHCITRDIESTIEFVASLGLIHNSAVCCNQPMHFVIRQNFSDGKAWSCCVCKRYRSIRRDSFFSGSCVPLPRLVELMFWWVEIDCKQSVIRRQVGIGTEAIVNWFKYFKGICSMWCYDHRTDENGAVLEINEEYTWRQFHRQSLFVSFIRCIRDYYPMQ